VIRFNYEERDVYEKGVSFSFLEFFDNQFPRAMSIALGTNVESELERKKDVRGRHRAHISIVASRPSRFLFSLVSLSSWISNSLARHVRTRVHGTVLTAGERIKLPEIWKIGGNKGTFERT